MASNMNGRHDEGAPIRVALIGGGLGGLSFAIALTNAKKKYGSNVKLDLYEGARAFAEIGAGIGMGQNAFEAMKYLGLEQDYQNIADPCEKCQWRYGEAGRPTGDANKIGELTFLHSTVHRAELLDIMVKKVPKEICHFGKRLVSWSSEGQGSPITLSFADDTEAVCDVLVGADGVKSVVRERMYADEKTLVDYATPRYTGTTATRGILPMELMKSIVGDEEATRPQMYLGVNKHLLIFPIQQGKTVNIVAFDSDRSVPDPVWNGGPGVAPIEPAEFLSSWTEWNERCVNILKAIKEPSQWALNELRNLPYYTKENVCLIGDAAHASLPHQGAGASQALEDGVILAELLTDCTSHRNNLSRALHSYDHLRRDRSTWVKVTSNELGYIMEFANPQYGDDAQKLKANLERRYDWIWAWKAEEAVQEALNHLHAQHAQTQ